MNLYLSQTLLLIAVFIFGLYVFQFRTVLSDRLIMLLLSGVGIILIVFPDISSIAAHKIGIGRGVDLIMYMFILFCLFRFVGISADSRKMETKVTSIIRTIAIKNARTGSMPEQSARYE